MTTQYDLFIEAMKELKSLHETMKGVECSIYHAEECRYIPLSDQIALTHNKFVQWFVEYRAWLDGRLDSLSDSAKKASDSVEKASEANEKLGKILNGDYDDEIKRRLKEGSANTTTQSARSRFFKLFGI